MGGVQLPGVVCLNTEATSQNISPAPPSLVIVLTNDPILLNQNIRFSKKTEIVSLHIFGLFLEMGYCQVLTKKSQGFDHPELRVSTVHGDHRVVPHKLLNLPPRYICKSSGGTLGTTRLNLSPSKSRGKAPIFCSFCWNITNLTAWLIGYSFNEHLPAMSAMW